MSSSFKNPDSPKNLSDTERFSWLRLIRSEQIGPRHFWQYLARYGTAAHALEALSGKPKAQTRAITLAPKEDIYKELEQTAKIGAKLIAACEPEYPPLLRHITDAPPVLTVRGDLTLLQKPMIGVVGSRHASLGGSRFAQQLSAELGEAGYAVVSGLARGIDGAAHRGALPHATLAVIAGGITHIYPREHHDLYEAIVKEGLVLTEMPFGATPRPQSFPARNRIISGMSYGVVVVEATLKSGSLITAYDALAQGREVFAVPGFPLEARSVGPNTLIKQGAMLTESAKDVMEALAYLGQNAPLPCAKETELGRLAPLADAATRDTQKVDASHAEVLKHLGVTAVTVDEVVAESQLPLAIIQAILLELELTGVVERHPGGKVALMPNTHLTPSF